MTYVPGAWRVVCARCGQWMLNTDLRTEWTGLRVCKECWDPKHPQMSVQGKVDKQAPPWTQPEPEDTFITQTAFPYDTDT